MVASNSFARAAVLFAAAASQVSALGNAIIHNQCDFDVYLWSVGASSGGGMETIPANGGAWSQQYEQASNGGGISIKLGADQDCQNITQYEYTLDGASLWYDLSNINGYPFAEWGVTVVPSDSTCRGVACPAGTALCAQAYNIPSDNYATAECGSHANSVVILCSGETDTSGSSSITSVASVVASTVAAASTSTYVVPAATTTEAVPTTTPSTTPVVVQTTTVVAPKSSTSVKKTTWVHHSVHHSSSHAAAPPHKTQETVQPASVTPKPTTTQAPANPYVVIETTFVTHVVTVEARSPQPTAEVKRNVHHHEHAAAHEHVARHHDHAHPRNFARR